MSAVQQEPEKPIRREHDSMDDFEHLEGDVQETGKTNQDNKARAGDGNLEEQETDQSHHRQSQPQPQPQPQEPFQAERDAMTQPDHRQQHHQRQQQLSATLDSKAASVLLLEAEIGEQQAVETTLDSTDPPKSPKLDGKFGSAIGSDQDLIQLSEEEDTPVHRPKFEEDDTPVHRPKLEEKQPETKLVETGGVPIGTRRATEEQDEQEQQDTSRETTVVGPSVISVPGPSPKTKAVEDDSWSVIENEQPAGRRNDNAYEISSDTPFNTEMPKKGGSAAEAESGGDSEFESEPDVSPAKNPKVVTAVGMSMGTASAPPAPKPIARVLEIEIAPKEIFSSMGLVAALIYWRDPKKSGSVFGAILGVLLSLAYFSLISVLAYLSLIVLIGTISFRIYKTVLQAIQKTSDGHPFKDILEADLTVPAEKVHEVADVAVAHANATVIELRRLFLVEDFVDSVKFGVVLWCFTYVGSWFNGMTLIIIGVIALFTLPKVYETNQAQIDQNFAMVHGKINELTAKVKAAIPLGKKAEPTKEE